MARRFISNYLSEYFLNLNTKTLSLSFWSGYLNCENLKLNPQKFNENKNLPIHLKDGIISKINMSLPIKSFFLGINNDIEITIEDIDINLITNSDFEFFDYTNFDYKYSFIKSITDDLLFKMELSKNPNFNDTYLTRSINYFLRNMKIIVKNVRIKLIHGTSDLYNAVFCANIDYINLKKDSFIIDKFYIYTENTINSNHNIRKKGHDYILLPITMKSEISLLKKNENEINNKENINIENNTNNENNNNNNNNTKEIETYYVDFEIDEINFSINKEQFILIMNLINFFIDYGNFYNNCFILRKIQYKKPKKENNNIINNNNDNKEDNIEKEKDKDKNYYYSLLRHYIKGLILIFKEKKFNIDVFDYYKDLNTERKKIFQNKFNDFFFKNKKDDEMIDIIRFTDEDVLKKWIEEMCDSIYKYQKESAQGFFSGIKSYFFNNAFEGMEISNLEEVSSRQKIICEFKGNINIITLSLKNYNEEIKLSILENEIEFFRGRINKILETRIGKIKLSFKHLINKSIFTKEIILPLVNDNENKEIYIKYIFKKFIPKTINEKSYLEVKCTSHVFIYNHSMFHSLYQFLYKDVTFMNKNFTHYKLFLRISSHKFDKENKVNLNINIANHKVIFPYLNYDYLNYYNDEKLEINFGDLDLKSSEQYDILVENISVNFIDKNLITHPIIKNFNFILKSSFDLNTNNLQLKNIEIQASIYLLQTLLYKTRNISESSKPENIWKIKNKNKNHIYNNAIKKGYLYYINKDNDRLKYYALISGGYIYLFKNNENPKPEYLIPLYDSFLEEKYYNNKIFGFNIIFDGKNSNGNQNDNKYEINFNTEEEMEEWKNSIDYRIEEINKSLINIKIKHKRKLSDPNQNNFNNSNINLNEEKEIDNKNNLKYGNDFSQLMLEESKRIRNNIINKFENNQQKKLRMYLDQIMKFVNSSKGNRHFTFEIENISLILNYSENESNMNINYEKGCKIILNKTKIEYIENNIFFIIQSYFGNIKFISNNINLIQVHDNLDENLDINCFINCNILICYDSSYILLDKNRDKLLKLIPNIKKKEEIEDFILKVKTNQIKINIFKELDISFESDEIFMNIKLIKDFFKKIKRKFDESIKIINKINININTEKNISLIHYDEINKSKYYLIIKKICSKENRTTLKDVHLMNIGNENKNNKIIIKEFDVIIKDSFNNQKIMYDIEFSSDICCYFDKNDFDNIYNIINDIRYTFRNNFYFNNKAKNGNNKINNFLRLFRMKIKKIEINFIISSIFRTKNYNEIKLILNNILINKEKSNNYIYIVEDIVLLRDIKNGKNLLENMENEKEILLKIPKSNNAIYISYENIKKDKRKLLDLVIDKIILNFQYELLYDFLNFFINIKYNSYHYQNKNNKENISNNLETSSNIPINSSFSNNTIISINNTMNNNLNINNEFKNLQPFRCRKENTPSNICDNNLEFEPLQLFESLIINLNINSFLLKIPVKQQKNNIIIQNELNESIIGNNLDEDDFEEIKKIQSEFFCIEFISPLVKFDIDLIESDRSLPYKRYLKIHSPETKIFIINEEINNDNKKIYLLSNNFSFFIELKYNYEIHKEMFIPQRKYNLYFYVPEELNINLNFEQLKSLLNIIIDIKNYYQESKLTYFTYCYLAEPEIYTTMKTLFLEICGHIQQKLVIRIEEFFEVIIKNLNLSYNDILPEKNNQEINILFALIIKYYNQNIKEYELFLEKYNFKFTARNNYFKFCSDDTSLIDCFNNEEENNIIDENDFKKEKNNNNLSESNDEINFNIKSENTFEKNNNPNGLSINITIELLYIINNIYDIFMLYKKCHVLQNIKNKNSLNSKNNNKSLLIYIYNYTTETIQINKINEIKQGEFMKYKINTKKDSLFDIKFIKSNIQYNEIKLYQLQDIIIYNKIYFCHDNTNKYYFLYPIMCKSFCQKEIIISNFSNNDSILLNPNKIQGLDINSFKNKTILFKINDNMIVSLNDHLIEKIKNYLTNNNDENHKIIVKDYFILKFEFIYNNKNVIKIEIFPRYIILNTLNIPIIFYGILNKYQDVNKKMIETELNIDGKTTDIFYPDLPQLTFKLKIIDNEVKNGNNEFISEISSINNDYIDDSFENFENSNHLNEINTHINISGNNLFNNNNLGYIENKKIKMINGKIKVKFKISEDLIIKIIYHTIPETRQIKIYLYMDYFILNNTKLNIYPLNNCISFNDKNFMVNYYPLKNFKNFQLVVADKILDKFEIRKEDYAFFTHIEVEIVKDKKINLLIQRHLRYFKLGEKLYKIDFLIISQIQKSNIDNKNNINNIVVNSNTINKMKQFSNELNNDKDNNNICNDDDVLMKLVKQRNFIDMPEVNDINHKFSFQFNLPSVYVIVIANNKNDNINNKNEFEFGCRYEIVSLYLDNIDFNFTQEKINFKKENGKVIEDDTISNININNIKNNFNKNNRINCDFDLNNNSNDILDDIEDTYNNNIELTIQSIQIDNLLQNVIYKIIFYNKKVYKKLLSPFNDNSYNYKNNYLTWLGMPFLSEKNKSNNLNEESNNNNMSNNKLLPFIHFKGSFINQDYKYYFKEINICFLPCYLYLDSEFSSELFLFISESYNIFKNKNLYYSQSIKEIIESLSFNLDSNFSSKFFMFISSFKVSPLTIFFNYKNFSNRFFNLLNLQSNFINTLLDVFTNNTTSIKFQFNSIVLYDINVRFNALLYKLYDYYYYTFLRECIKIIFSVDILGDPYHLLSHLSQGISNFITLPILSIFNGPSDFIFYLLYGTKSLLSNSIGGLLDSLHKFTNSISKNILKLTNSEEYVKSRNKILIKENYLDENLINYLENNKRKRNYNNNSNGFNLLLISKILGNGIKYGFRDLIVIPYKYYQNNGMIELPIGVILGTLSLIVKPISSTMDSISILSNSISHEILKGEKNYDIDEDYMYYSYNKKRQRREWIYDDKKIRRYKEENIDILLKLIGDCFNIDNEIERGIINGNYYIDKLFITKYKIKIDESNSNEILFNNDNEINEMKNIKENKDQINNNFILSFTVITFIKNIKNNEFSIMIYIININRNKNERKFELFKNKNKSDKDYKISMNLQYIIPCKDIISLNYNKNDKNINILYQKERKREKINNTKIIHLLKFNNFGAFYRFLYFNKEKAYININFSSKYILNEFLDYYSKIKYNVIKPNMK